MQRNYEEWQYLDRMRDLIQEGHYREGRNGATYSLFGTQMKFNLRYGFPLLTTKKMFTKGIIAELIWFLRGRTDLEFLHQHGVHIWDANAKANGGKLGRVYGAQWRNWYGWQTDVNSMPLEIDQIKNVIDGIKKDPYGRRHIVTAWNPAEIEDMALPPCHCMFQFHVADGKLSCHMYQRSADWFLGVPFNIASYALLTHLVARECGLDVGTFIHSFGDYHLYANHREQALAQIARLPYRFPTLLIDADAPGIFEIEPKHIKVEGYISHDSLTAEMSA